MKHVISTRTVNAFVVTYATTGPARLLRSEYERTFDGEWVGGRATLLASALRVRTGTIVGKPEGDVVIPLVEIERVSFSRSILTNTITVVGHHGSARIRCFKARSFADEIVQGVNKMRENKRADCRNAVVVEQLSDEQLITEINYFARAVLRGF